MTDQKRIGALLLCVGMALVLFVSSAYIVHEAGHVCSGEDCNICRMIAVCADLFSRLGLAVLVLLALFAVQKERFARRERQMFCVPASDTLVGRKIRLDY